MYSVAKRETRVKGKGRKESEGTGESGQRRRGGGGAPGRPHALAPVAGGGRSGAATPGSRRWRRQGLGLGAPGGAKVENDLSRHAVVASHKARSTARSVRHGANPRAWPAFHQANGEICLQC